MQKPLCVVRNVERPFKIHFLCFNCPYSVQGGNVTHSFSYLRKNIRTQNLQLQIPRQDIATTLRSYRQLLRQQTAVGVEKKCMGLKK
jgi:hypothetical protein